MKDYDENENYINFSYELINKMIFVTFLHFQYLSKNMNFLIKKFNINAKNYHHIIDKIIVREENIKNWNPKDNINLCNNGRFIIIIIGNEISRLQFISHEYNINKITDILSENNNNILNEDIVQLLFLKNFKKPEPSIGVEPITFGLQDRCSAN